MYVKTGYEYDGDGNLTLHSVRTAEGILAENRYAYDGNGNITAKSGLYGEYHYSYDELNRLTQECFAAAGQGSLATDSYTTCFTYDGAENRISMEQGGIK